MNQPIQMEDLEQKLTEEQKRKLVDWFNKTLSKGISVGFTSYHKEDIFEALEAGVRVNKEVEQKPESSSLR